MPLESVIIQLSDLHFGDGPGTYPASAPLPVHWLLPPHASLYLNNLVLRICTPHDKRITDNLKTSLFRIAKELRREGYVWDPDTIFDVFIVSGDVTTFPSAQAIQNAANWLLADRLRDPRTIGFGLSHHRHRLLLVGGNHDKFLRNHLFHLRATFGFDIPHGPCPKFFYRTVRNKPYLFLLIDTNTYSPSVFPVGPNVLALRQSVARGRISDTTISRIEATLDDLARGRGTGDLNGIDYANARRFVVMHHPVEIRGVQNQLLNVLFPHHCDNVRRLMRVLRGKSFIVLHGHMHVSDSYTSAGTRVVATGTTSQLQTAARLNDLTVFKIYSTGQVRRSVWEWNGSGFSCRYINGAPDELV